MFYQPQPQYGYNSYNPQMFNTMGYGIPQRPKGTNGLTVEQAQELQQNAGLNLMPTKEEYLQAICTHRDLKSGQNVLVADETGSNLTCPICASQFRALNMTEQDVKEAVDTVSDVLENIKMLYLDIPPEVCQEFMKILPMVKKIPALYKIAAANFRQYENAVTTAQNGPSSLIGQYNYINSPMGPSGFTVPNPYPQQMNMGGFQQPMYQQPMPQYQQPAPQQAYMMPYQNDMVQPMGYSQQQMDMTGGMNPFFGQPQNVNPQFTNMQGQPQQPQNNCNCGNHQEQVPQNGTVEVEKKFNV